MDRAHPLPAAEAVLTYQPEPGGGWGPKPTLAPAAGTAPSAALASLSSLPWWVWAGGAAVAYFLFVHRRRR